MEVEQISETSPVYVYIHEVENPIWSPINTWIIVKSESLKDWARKIRYL
jgi:hypothetical protein